MNPRAADRTPIETKNVSGWAFLNRLHVHLPWIFVLLAAPMIIFLAVVTPPFQSPDEPNHFVRAYQISHGHIFGNLISVDVAIDHLIELYADIAFHPDVGTNATIELAAKTIQWTGRSHIVEIDNTITYSPTGYIPQALAIFAGEHAGLSVLETLRLTRLLNGAVALSIGALALFLCRRGSYVLFSLLLLPMSLSLFASSSHDATILVVTALGFSLVSHVLAESRSGSVGVSVAIAACLFVVAIARPPYASLLLVLFVPGVVSSPRGGTPYFLTVCIAGVPFIGILAWIKFYAMGFPAPGSNWGADPGAQFSYLLHNLGSIPALVQNTLAADYRRTDAEFVGVLGWLDTVFPPFYYRAAEIALIVAIAAELGREEAWQPSATGLVVIAGFGAIAGLYVAEYFIWTKVGSATIVGMQGRYLIPLAIAAAVTIPRIPRLRWISQIALLVILFPLLTLYELPQVILHRYYLALN